MRSGAPGHCLHDLRANHQKGFWASASECHPGGSSPVSSPVLQMRRVKRFALRS